MKASSIVGLWKSLNLVPIRTRTLRVVATKRHHIVRLITGFLVSCFDWVSIVRQSKISALKK